MEKSYKKNLISPIQYNKGGRKSEPFTDINTKKEKNSNEKNENVNKKLSV